MSHSGCAALHGVNLNLFKKKVKNNCEGFQFWYDFQPAAVLEINFATNLFQDISPRFQNALDFRMLSM